MKKLLKIIGILIAFAVFSPISQLVFLFYLIRLLRMKYKESKAYREEQRRLDNIDLMALYGSSNKTSTNNKIISFEEEREKRRVV